MTIPVNPRHSAPARSDATERASSPQSTSATQLELAIGPRVIEVLDLAYRARRPVLLEGSTGIGKSQIVSEFAKASGLEIVILDLSLLEPPDLIGLPVIEGNRTRYASPAELPVSGRGVLMLEELNRAELPVMQPALQLLSARRLHAYELPPGWTCVAAVNPEDGDYQVNHLDPALRSRFLQLSVCSDRDAWLEWAARANVHPVVTRVVRDHADAFEHASPRSWAYASEILHALHAEEFLNRDLVRVALRGYLPTSWAIVVTDALASHPESAPVDSDVLFSSGGEAALARIVRDLEATKRIDAIAMLASKLRRLLASDDLCGRVEAGAVTLASLEKLLAALPGDLREQCLESAVESSAALALLSTMGHEPGNFVSSYDGSSLRREVQSWRRDMKLHRVRLVVVAVSRWLARTEPGDLRALENLAAPLALLIADAGPLAQDLARWLRVRGLSSEARSAP